MFNGCSGTAVRSICADNTLSAAEASTVTNLAVGKTKVQEKLTPIGDATNSKVVLPGAAVRSIGVDNTLTDTQANIVINLGFQEC